MTPPLRRLLSLTLATTLALAVTPRHGSGQDPAGGDPGQRPQAELSAADQQRQQELAQAAAQFAVPDEVAAAVEVDPDDMKATLAPATTAKLQAVLGDWMALVRVQQQAYAAAQAAPEGSEARAGADGLGTDRDALIARAEAVIELLAEREGDVDDARATIQQLRETETDAAVDASTVPQDQTKAQAVDLEVLKAQLRPLMVGEVEAQLTDWMALLQKKCFEVRKAEVAALRAASDEDIRKFSAAAVELRAERDQLLKRVKVVVTAFADKAGDETAVARHRAYLSSVVVTPTITGWQAAWTTLTAWLVNPDGGVAWAVGLLKLVLTLVAFRLIGLVLSRLLNRTLRAVSRTPELLRDFFVNMTRKLTMLVGVIVAVGQIGIDITPLVAAIGGAAFVIGFALQGTLSNFAAGLMILMYRPYNVGDVVEVGGTTGKVHGQSLVSTTIKTFDNKTIIVPNNTIWGDVITNATASTTRRVDMVFGIGYGDDIGKAERILREILDADDRVLRDPAPVVQVNALGDSSVDFVVRPWVRTPDYWDVYWAVTRAVKERFDAEGVSIPFPQRDVHVYRERDAGAGDLLPRPDPGRPQRRAGAAAPQRSARQTTTADGGLDDADADEAVN